MRRFLLVCGLLALALTGCVHYPGQDAGPVDQNVDNLGGVRFSQSQAVPGFDTSSYTLSEAQVEAFRDLLLQYSVDPGDYRTPDTHGCTGGITTRAQLWFHDNGDREMIIDGCGATDESFELAATQFFADIRGGTVELGALQRVYFTQDDDDHGYLQEDPAELDRLEALLDEYAVVPGDLNDLYIPDPCTGGIQTIVNLMYSGEVRDLRIDSCVGDDWSTAATAFFADWKALSLDGGEWQVVEQE